MTKFEKKSPPGLDVAIWSLIAGVFAADHVTPYGASIYMAYMIPMSLSFFCWKPRIPWILALTGILLIIIAYFTTPEGPGRELSEVRRIFAGVTLLVLAGIGHQFIKTRLTARREAWLQFGQSEIGKRLVGDQSMKTLGENVLGFLTEYLGAQAGAVFVKDGEIFRRTAIHAAADNSVPEQFGVESGLLGQAVKDGRHAVLSDLPEGYISVGSGLGKTVPRNLVIFPVAIDEKVNAVIELGFFSQVEGSDIELISRIEHSVSVAVRSVKYRMKLQELLEETQRQSEEVQAQSEELRVSNEELEEQSRALRESQSRLELQQTELEQINTQLEEQTQILERQKADLLDSKVALEIQAKEVEQASRYKSDFLANMSHELRTPLNSSLILAKLLADNRNGNLTEDQVRYAKTIESAGNDLLNLINDVLDLSKIEAGHMEVNAVEVSISGLMNGLKNTFQPIASEKGLEFSIVCDPNAPDRISTDPQRLEQILKNLLSNALKFTDGGGEVRLQFGRSSGKRVCFTVSDTGIGIASEKQRVIFDPFYQADGTTSRKYGGTGLGLSISRNLSRLLGGGMTLSSEPGKGSSFTLDLPEIYDGPQNEVAEIPTELPVKVEAVQEAEPVRSQPVGQVPDDRDQVTGNERLILVVEDDKPFAEIIYELAHELHFECLVATSAEEALDLAHRFVPSAIVLDVGLPDNSGLTVLERLKADHRTRHIPVHIVSASDYTRTALELGAVGYMLKPVKREQLIDAFHKLEDRISQILKRVLVVEDDAVQVEAMRDLLSSRDVEAVCARSAAECLEHLGKSTFDCMVLDLSLPDASGFTLLEKLSKEHAYSFPPVIVYTGRVLSPEEEQRLRRYSRSIIIKGAKSHERLLDEVTLFLHQVVSELPPEKRKLLEKAGNRDEVLEGRRILIAEDDVRNVFALTSLLEGRGVQLQIARNGREALEALERSVGDPAKRIDLVLMDVMMPEMDGITAMKEIRKRQEWKKLPVIALTAKAMKSDQEHCLAAGANDYLAKPLDVEKLLSLIRVWMPR